MSQSKPKDNHVIPEQQQPQQSLTKNSDASLTHLNQRGEIHMVDIAQKPNTKRIAIAEVFVILESKARQSVVNENNKKGELLATARLAGIQAAKRTSETIPLCHPLYLSHVAIDIKLVDKGLHVTAQTETTGPTGVEMEAMCAASATALTLYDMLKAVERGISISGLQLVHKSGGRSGEWNRNTPFSSTP